MHWRPSISMENLKKRAIYMRQIRSFFEEREVIEVETPLMSQASVADAALEVFITQYTASSPQTCYLATSPEYPMKRLLTAGSGPIFQLGKVFRNGESGRFHNPEFTLLEWYRPGYDSEALMEEISDLVSLILGTASAGCERYCDLFKRHLDLDPLSVDLSTLTTCAQRSGLVLTTEPSRVMLLQFLFSEKIEAIFAQQRPMFVYHFPADQAALAELNAADPRVAERFELYFQGLELANGFFELRCAQEQRRRFLQEQALYKAQHGVWRPIDERFLAALEAGLPRCSGVALGVDRLLMLAMGASKIDDVIPFTLARA